MISPESQRQHVYEGARHYIAEGRTQARIVRTLHAETLRWGWGLSQAEVAAIVADAWASEDARSVPTVPVDDVRRHTELLTSTSSPSSEFVRRSSGHIVADDVDNIRIALRRFGVTLTYDAFAHRALVDGADLDDDTVDRLWMRIIDAFKFRPKKDTLRTVLSVEARAAAHHPVRAYLDRLVWDGKARLDAWLTTYGGAPSSPYVSAVGALPLLAAVRRVRQPGAKFDELLILESEQGVDKSGAVRSLCPDERWFSDDLPLGADAKQVIERTGGRWIIEAGDLHGYSSRSADQLKAFLSRQVDGPVRLAYGRLSSSVERQFVMIGTTNKRIAYLNDATGARRFWPVTVERFELAALRRDRDQLWAEAAAREAAGASIRLASELWMAAQVHQEQRREVDPWEERLGPLFEDTNAVPVEAVWQVLGVTMDYRNIRHSRRVAAIAQRFGFTREKVRRDGGKPIWWWVRDANA